LMPSFAFALKGTRMNGFEPKTDFQILSREDLHRIHLASLRVLEDVGVAVHDDHCLELLRRSGATVNEKTKIALIPEHLVDEALRSTPGRIHLHARNPKYDLRLEGKRVHFAARGPNVPKIIDIDSGVRRNPTNRDVEDLAKLADGLENVHAYGGITTTTDVAAKVADVHRFAITFNNIEKVVFDGAPGKVNAQAFIRMAAAVVGSIEELRRRPLIAGFGCPVAPLQHPADSLDWLVEFAKNKLPYCVLSEPMEGASAPVTLAGGLVVMNAEILSGIVIAQLVNRGTPIIYGATPFPIDMKTGSLLAGTPEVGLTSAVSTQLAQYYDIPSFTECTPDTKVLDAQLAFESAPIFAPAMTGCNLIGAAGTIESGLTASFEQMVLADEFLDLIYRLMRGLELTEETLAVDVINKVGPGGQFLSNPHTRIHAMKELWYPKLIDRQSLGRWKETGAKRMEQRANERAKEILRTHKPAPLERSVQNELYEIVKETESVLLKRSPQ